MLRFKKHFLIQQYNNHRYNENHNGFHTLCLRRHRDFFLHKVYKQMEHHAGQNGAVADQIHPSDDISHKNGTHTGDYEVESGFRLAALDYRKVIVVAQDKT